MSATMTTYLDLPLQETKDIYLNGRRMDSIREHGRDVEGTLPSEIVSAVLNDEKFVYEDELTLGGSIGGKVGRGEMECPLCRGSQSHYPRCRFVGSGARFRREVKCVCAQARWFYTRVDRMVPIRYRDVDLWELQPSSAVNQPLDQQERVLALLRETRRSLLLCGRTGTGKTTYATALFLDELRLWVNRIIPRNEYHDGVWRADAAELLREHTDFHRRVASHNATAEGEQGMAPQRPSLCLENIRRAARNGGQPVLFLDEVDKATLTQAQLVILFGLIDEVYKCRGLVVISSNSSVHELCERFGKEMGPALLRRIVGDGGLIVDLSRGFIGHCPAVPKEETQTKEEVCQ